MLKWIMEKKLIPYLFLLWFLPRNLAAQTFNLGRFSIAESRVLINFDEFVVSHNNPNVRAKWVPRSVQWIRNEKNLLVPRAILRILIKKNESTIHLSYQGKTIFPFKKEKLFVSQLYIDLFNADPVLVFDGNQLLEKIEIMTKVQKTASAKKLIDYSCSPYDLKIEGLDDEYLSVGCKMNHLGAMGKETPRLEINLSGTNLQTINHTKPPYTFYLEEKFPVEIKLKGAKEEMRTLSIKAHLPEKLHRLKTALGLGPYIYQSKFDHAEQKGNIAPSVMIYGKFDLTETASFKAFDALLYSKTFFNNSGFYFSYDLASALDDRVLINALLGFQGIHYKYAVNSPTIFRLIYPQGFEVIYKHAFIENYNLTYGMFISTNAEKYTNAWLRYGKRSFLELNYFNWGHGNSQLKMWGVSVGFPFFSVF